MAVPTPSSKTVIIATRDPHVSDRFSTALRGASHQTVELSTRDELLRQLRTPAAVADLLVLDLRLGNPGTEIIRAVRAADYRIPVVILSGSVESATDIRILEALGVSSYVNEHCAVHHIVPSLAPRLFPDSFDRRTSSRLTLNLPVAYRFSDTIATAPTLNVGKGGLGVRTMTPLETGTKVQVRFRLPGSQRDINADSRVAWSDQRTGMGLQFEEVATRDQSAVDEFVDQQSQQSQQSPDGA